MYKIKFKDILFSKIVMFFSFLIFLLTNCYIDIIPNLKSIVNIIVIVDTVLISVYYFGVRAKATKISMIICLYLIVAGISTFWGEQAEISFYLQIYLKIFGCILYLELCLKNDSRTTYNILNNVMRILIFINFTTIVCFPNGLYNDGLYDNNWFFLYDNMHILYYLLSITLITINVAYNKKIKFLDILQIICILFGIFKCFSATSVVATIILLCFCLFDININTIFLFCSYLSINIAVVFFQIQKYFAWLIENVLGKSLTLSNRVFIWDKVIKLVQEKIFFGYGFERNDVFAFKIGNEHYTHAHNTILDVFYKTGIIGLSVYMYIIVLVMKELNKYRKYRFVRVLINVFVCVFIITTFESREDRLTIYMIMIICANIYNIIKDLEEKNVKS